MDVMEKVQQINGDILGLKQLLTNSDYKAIKYSEGLISEAEYASVKEYREELRTKINQLEEELEAVNALFSVN